MLSIEQFREDAHKMVDRIADYFAQVEEYPVKSMVKPGEILKQLPQSPPEAPETYGQIMADFDSVLLPGITHWQSPNFFAYFPANSSYPSVLAEMLTAALGQQGMVWETSPAAAELEERMMEWLKELCGLPATFTGVIQDTASASTLAALLCARERASGFRINETGFMENDRFRIYCSTETHSSIEKDVKIAGFGKANLVKIEVDDRFAMRADLLEQAILSDLANGMIPLCVVGTLGTTGSTAVDPLRRIGEIAGRHNLWYHVDGAYGGTALVLPHMRALADGLELADSYVFNPHKWMFTNFDCSAFYVKDPQVLIRTFEIMPEYLKTKADSQVKNYRDWGVALGRRFRALKLWFVLRGMGASGIREKVAAHLEMAQWLTKQVEEHPDFELAAPTQFGLVCFRYSPAITDADDITRLNSLNEKLLHAVNATGNMYFTHTKLNGKYTLRLVIAQTYVKQHHVEKAWQIIAETANQLTE